MSVTNNNTNFLKTTLTRTIMQDKQLKLMLTQMLHDDVRINHKPFLFLSVSSSVISWYSAWHACSPEETSYLVSDMFTDTLLLNRVHVFANFMFTETWKWRLQLKAKCLKNMNTTPGLIHGAIHSYCTERGQEQFKLVRSWMHHLIANSIKLWYS